MRKTVLNTIWKNTLFPKSGWITFQNSRNTESLSNHTEPHQLCNYSFEHMLGEEFMADCLVLQSSSEMGSSNQEPDSTCLTLSSHMNPNGSLYKGNIGASKIYNFLLTQRIQSLVLQFSVHSKLKVSLLHKKFITKINVYFPLLTPCSVWFCFMHNAHLFQIQLQ